MKNSIFVFQKQTHMQNSVSGFSKFTKAEKIDWLISNHFQNNPKAKAKRRA